MHRWWRPRGSASPVGDRLRTDGGEEDDGRAGDDSEQTDENADRPAEDEAGDAAEVEQGDGVDRANVEVKDTGEAEPANPKWEKPDLEDIPEFEIRADEPVAGTTSSEPTEDGDVDDPTAGRPNTARSPGQSRIKREGTEGYVAALELCARLPEDTRLPDQAADLVPAAVEAELEDDIQGFAASEFDNPAPHVDELSFVEVDDEIWLRIRLGVRSEAFDDLDSDAIRDHALQELEGLF